MWGSSWVGIGFTRREGLGGTPVGGRSPASGCLSQAFPSYGIAVLAAQSGALVPEASFSLNTLGRAYPVQGRVKWVGGCGSDTAPHCGKEEMAPGPQPLSTALPNPISDGHPGKWKQLPFLVPPGPQPSLGPGVDSGPLPPALH